MLMSECLGVEAKKFAPANTNPVEVKWVDLQDFDGLMVGVLRTAGAGDLTISIKGSSKADGSDSQTIVSKVFDAGQPYSINDLVFLEMSQNDVLKIGEVYRYFSAVISSSDGAGDECAVFYLKGKPLHMREGLTSDIVA